MTEIIHVQDPHDNKSKQDDLTIFKFDIHQGFEKNNKQILSKYFYDEHGCELFNKITRHPDYYLTKCELEILHQCKKKLSDYIGDKSFNLVELGPGEGIKTQILIDQFIQDNLHFRYTPIDISTKYLNVLSQQFHKKVPGLKLTAIHADYFKGLEWLSEKSEQVNLVLFLGSSIGNFTLSETEEFIRHLHEVLHDGDYVFLGFDLRKNIDILLRAYNDSDNITRDFNLNLLSRINRDLSANFDLNKFNHYATYNVYTGAMESYLISLEKQIVNIEKIGKSFVFDEIEPIHVEYSHKFLISQIEDLAKQNYFQIVEHFTDTKNYFVDTLWRVVK